MVDYARTLASAQRQIRDKGRLVSLQGATAGAADANDPLAGPAAPPAPVTGVAAVFVPPSSLQALGSRAQVEGLFANCSQIAIAAADGANDFKDMVTLIDSDNSVWKIQYVEELKPGEVPLLYFIGVAR